MVTWTIRDVPDEWDRLMKRYATEHKCSKNQELLDLFGQALHQRLKRMSVEEMRSIAEATAALPGPSDFDADAFLYVKDGLPE